MGINSGTSFLNIFAKRPFTKVLIAAYQVVNRASVLLSGMNQGDNYKKKKVMKRGKESHLKQRPRVVRKFVKFSCLKQWVQIFSLNIDEN